MVDWRRTHISRISGGTCLASPCWPVVCPSMAAVRPLSSPGRGVPSADSVFLRRITDIDRADHPLRSLRHSAMTGGTTEGGGGLQLTRPGTLAGRRPPRRRRCLSQVLYSRHSCSRRRPQSSRDRSVQFAHDGVICCPRRCTDHSARWVPGSSWLGTGSRAALGTFRAGSVQLRRLT